MIQHGSVVEIDWSKVKWAKERQKALRGQVGVVVATDEGISMVNVIWSKGSSTGNWVSTFSLKEVRRANPNDVVRFDKNGHPYFCPEG